MQSFTKLFSSITASTVWAESNATRIVWITMLAMTDSCGCVYASIPGLARIAIVTPDEVRTALACFLAPDPDSRTKDHEGRRIKEIDGGWQLLNYEKYSHAKAREDKNAYQRALMQQRREREKLKKQSRVVSSVSPNET